MKLLEQLSTKRSQELTEQVGTLDNINAQRIAELQRQLEEVLKDRAAKESAYFKELNEALDALIKDFNAERTSLREGIGSLVSQQLDEQKVFQKIDDKVEYLENLLDLQNKGFDEKISREVTHALSESISETQKNVNAINEQLKSIENYVESKNTESRSLVADLVDGLRKDSVASSEAVRGYIGSLDNKYAKRLDAMKEGLDERLQETKDFTSRISENAITENKDVLANLQRRVDNIDNITALSEDGDEQLRTEMKSKLEQLRANLEPMINQRVESRMHAAETRLDDKYGRV